MARRFRQLLSQMIPSFQSCRSSDPSIPCSPHHAPTLHPGAAAALTPSIPNSTSQHRRRRRRRRSSFSFGCGLCSRPARRYPSDDESSEAERRGADAGAPKTSKAYNTSVPGTSDDDAPALKTTTALPPPPLAERRRKKKQRSKKKRRRAAARVIRLSTSSADSGFFFSSEGGGGYPFRIEEEGEGETEALVSSSRSSPTSGESSTKRAASSAEEGARLSAFQRVIPCGVGGKVRESFAVVKRSEEPYEDFKRSMVEMITEKNMFEAADLEQLLHCFLSLNTRCHHAPIIRAFAEIWETLFRGPGLQGRPASLNNFNRRVPSSPTRKQRWEVVNSLIT